MGGRDALPLDFPPRSVTEISEPIHDTSTNIFMPPRGGKGKAKESGGAAVRILLRCSDMGTEEDIYRKEKLKETTCREKRTVWTLGGSSVSRSSKYVGSGRRR